MCDKVHIYLVDEESRKWHIVNSLIHPKYKNRFIVYSWYNNRYDFQTHGNTKGIRIEIVGFDGEKLTMFIPEDKMLRLTRMIKLLGLQKETDFFTFEERVKVNELRFKSLSERINKNIRLKKEPYISNNDWYWNRRKPSKKSLRTIKRQKLAKENRSNNKSKNR